MRSPEQLVREMESASALKNPERLSAFLRDFLVHDGLSEGPASRCANAITACPHAMRALQDLFKSQAYDNRPVRSPSQALRRRGVIALEGALPRNRTYLADDPVLSATKGYRIDEELFRAELAESIMQSDVILWDESSAAIVSEIPSEMSVTLDPEEFFSRRMLWIFESDLGIGGTDISGSQFLVDCLESGVYATFWIGRDITDAPGDYWSPADIAVLFFPYGEYSISGASTSDWLSKSALALLLSLNAFLRSPYIPKHTELVPNPKAHRRQRQSKNSTVTMVYLRKVAGESVGDRLDPGAEGGDVKRTYANRWIVSGHMRNQAYGPGRSKRRLIFVPPHVKGPDDAPFKEKVYAVRR